MRTEWPSAKVGKVAGQKGIRGEIKTSAFYMNSLKRILDTQERWRVGGTQVWGSIDLGWRFKIEKSVYG